MLCFSKWLLNKQINRLKFLNVQYFQYSFTIREQLGNVFLMPFNTDLDLEFSKKS